MSDYNVMIIAGEASGDLHGARLADAFKKLSPGIEICGMGGNEMANAGVELLCDISRVSVMGITEVFGRFFDILKALKTLKKMLHSKPPDLVILIDFPDFNLIMASKAKRLNIPVFYYISPKVWAWRTGRVKKIRKLVDQMAVILPFEQEFYWKHGMAVDFVGNPLLDSVKTSLTKQEFLDKHGIDKEKTIVGILPGSRKQEIRSLLPIFLEASERIVQEHKNTVFLMPLASTLSIADLEENGIDDSKLDIRIISEEQYNLMASCDAVMAASGTVTLELAILDVPMVVSYRFSPVTYFLAKRFVKVRFASLVNLVVGYEVVPELLHENATAEKIANAVLKLLKDKDTEKIMRNQLADVRKRLGNPGASERTARLALKLITDMNLKGK